jgi:hypothetical protein
MTRFEKIKNMTIVEMAKAVQILVDMDLCFDESRKNCSGCIFYELCAINTPRNALVWLESEVET